MIEASYGPITEDILVENDHPHYARVSKTDRE